MAARKKAAPIATVLGEVLPAAEPEPQPPSDLTRVEEAFRDALSKRCKYTETQPPGITSTYYQVSNRTPSNKPMLPEAIGQALATQLDQGGATACDCVVANVNPRDKSRVSYGVRGWR